MPPVKKPKSGILKESNTDNQKKKEDIFARAARGSKITKAKGKTAVSTKKSEQTPKKKKAASNVINGSLAPVRTGLHYPGCHVSAAGGVDNAVSNAVGMNARSFAMFIRNQRTWQAKPLDPKAAEKFQAELVEHAIPPHLVIPHGSYLVNLGSPKPEIRQKSRDTLIDELNRCAMLGLPLFNIHPGSSCGDISREECIKYIAEGINGALSVTKGVKVVLENMSKQGNTIGGDLQEIRDIMELVEDQTRIGVCLDTCHAMAAGYDLSKQEGFDRLLTDFHEIIGFEWLVAMHLNDSKGEAGCRKDRHETIGKGKIGKEGFRRIMNCKHFTDIPLILETPYTEGSSSYAPEIQLLADLAKE